MRSEHSVRNAVNCLGSLIWQSIQMLNNVYEIKKKNLWTLWFTFQKKIKENLCVLFGSNQCSSTAWVTFCCISKSQLAAWKKNKNKKTTVSFSASRLNSHNMILVLTTSSTSWWGGNADHVTICNHLAPNILSLTQALILLICRVHAWLPLPVGTYGSNWRSYFPLKPSPFFP